MHIATAVVCACLRICNDHVAGRVNEKREGCVFMTIVVPLDHKQIAYVSYEPDEKCLIVTYHRGESRKHQDVDYMQFYDFVESGNKFDKLCSLMSNVVK
jgi:hypothetical protein